MNSRESTVEFFSFIGGFLAPIRQNVPARCADRIHTLAFKRLLHLESSRHNHDNRVTVRGIWSGLVSFQVRTGRNAELKIGVAAPTTDEIEEIVFTSSFPNDAPPSLSDSEESSFVGHFELCLEELVGVAQTEWGCARVSAGFMREQRLGYVYTKQRSLPVKLNGSAVQEDRVSKLSPDETDRLEAILDTIPEERRLRAALEFVRWVNHLSRERRSKTSMTDLLKAFSTLYGL